MRDLFLKKWVFLVVVLFFNLLIALRTNIFFFYAVFWLVAGVVSISLIWTLICWLTAGIFFKRIMPYKVIEDDTLEITLNIQNPRRLALLNIVIEDTLACAAQDKQKRTLLEFLAGHSSLNIRYNCMCYKRGKYNIGPLKVYFIDPLSIFYLKRLYQVYSEVYVYPRIFKISDFPPIARGILPWFGIDTVPTSGDDDEFYGLREYRSGDPIKRVHWISTARKGNLIVKQFQRQFFSRASIIFNLEKERNYGEGRESVAEYIIRIAASVSKYLSDKGVSLELIAQALELVEIPFNKGEAHLEDIFKFLALAQAQSRLGLGEIFEKFSRYLPDNSTLIVIMLDKDWEYFPQLLPLSKRNISLIPIILLSSTFLSSFERGEVLKDVKIKISQTCGLRPLVVSCGDRLEQVFSKL